MTEEARKEGLEIQAAFEHEFYLLQNNREESVQIPQYLLLLPL
jgi:glutamine synthetase